MSSPIGGVEEEDFLDEEERERDITIRNELIKLQHELEYLKKHKADLEQTVKTDSSKLSELQLTCKKQQDDLRKLQEQYDNLSL